MCTSNRHAWLLVHHRRRLCRNPHNNYMRPLCVQCVCPSARTIWRERDGKPLPSRATRRAAHRYGRRNHSPNPLQETPRENQSPCWLGSNGRHLHRTHLVKCGRDVDRGHQGRPPPLRGPGEKDMNRGGQIHRRVAGPETQQEGRKWTQVWSRGRPPEGLIEFGHARDHQWIADQPTMVSLRFPALGIAPPPAFQPPGNRCRVLAGDHGT